MKKILLSLLMLFSTTYSISLFAQAATWMNGANTNDDIGNYGTLGIEAATNKPGSRREFVTWKDNSGNLWMFGGFGRATSSITGQLSDLWKYNQTTNQWTWVNGPNTRNQVGVYGTINVAASTNRPGGRRWATGWADNAGNLWLFGGFGYAAANVTGRLNDLWKYNIASNQWTWISGSNAVSQVGDYITVGALRPGARQRPCSWFDGTDAWVFGGDGYSSGATPGTLNDLWKVNLSTGAWTFMAGNDATSVAGVYGTLGVSDPANKPGAREYAMSWFHDGKLYLFGGGVGTVSYFNDLWSYDVTTNVWTWIKGSNTVNQTGTYGSYWAIDPANNPGARQVSVALKDNQNRVFVFGGQGYGTAATSGILNDIWCYRFSDNTWTWVGGQNTTDGVATYGTLGVYAASNKIGARYGAGGWTDAAGNMILFGGFGNTTNTTSGYLSDLWYYNSNAVLPITLESFGATIENADVQLTWVTSNEVNNDYFTVMHSTDGKNFEDLGIVRSRGNSTAATTYSFQHTSPDWKQDHYYQLKQTDLDGKSSLSEVVKIDRKPGAGLDANVWVDVMKQAHIRTTAQNGFILKVYAENGQCVLNNKMVNAESTLDVSGWTSGLYYVQVHAGSQIKTIKMAL